MWSIVLRNERAGTVSLISRTRLPIDVSTDYFMNTFMTTFMTTFILGVDIVWD